jgi:hypothetical protein
MRLNINCFTIRVLFAGMILLPFYIEETAVAQNKKADLSENQTGISQVTRFLEINDRASDKTIYFTERLVDGHAGELEFKKTINEALGLNLRAENTPQYVWIAHQDDMNPLENDTALLSWGKSRTKTSHRGYLHMVSVKEKRTSVMSIAVAIIKSSIGVFYYFHYVPAFPALIGSLFSTFHNMVFTAFPIAEQRLLLDPLKSLFGLSALDLSQKAKNIDLAGTTVHKLLNLGIVTTIINWEDLNLLEISKDVVTSALMYTIIKSFWKIHFDYQYKAKRISDNFYFFIVPSLELVAYGIMPAIMLEKPWAIAVGTAMALSGALNYFLRRTNFSGNVQLSCRDIL